MGDVYFLSPVQLIHGDPLPGDVLPLKHYEHEPAVPLLPGAQKQVASGPPADV